MLKNDVATVNKCFEEDKITLAGCMAWRRIRKDIEERRKVEAPVQQRATNAVCHKPG